jgi:hypothetical protein
MSEIRDLIASSAARRSRRSSHEDEVRCDQLADVVRALVPAHREAGNFSWYEAFAEPVSPKICSPSMRRCTT